MTKSQHLPQQTYFLSIVWTVTNNKNELWKNVRLTIFQKPTIRCDKSIRLILACFCICCVIRATFVWPWNEKVQTKQKKQTNGNRAILLVYRADTNARGLWFVKRTPGCKNFMPESFLKINPILRFDAILQHDWPMEQCLLHIRVFFGGKTKSPCFNLFIHCLIK